MNIFEAAHITSRPRWVKGILGPLLSLGLLFATGSQNLSACQVAQALPVGAPPTEHAPPYTQETSKQLQQLYARP